MRLSRSRGVIRLGRVDTKRWEDGGPEGDAFRRLVRDVAHEMADMAGRSVEIYASESAGGWMADQIAAEAD